MVNIIAEIMVRIHPCVSFTCKEKFQARRESDLRENVKPLLPKLSR